MSKLSSAPGETSTPSGQLAISRSGTAQPIHTETDAARIVAGSFSDTAPPLPFDGVLAYSLLLTSGTAQTSPPFIPTIIGEGGLDWPAMAAGTTLFLLPVLFFTILLRKHLLRGITFGAIRK